MKKLAAYPMILAALAATAGCTSKPAPKETVAKTAPAGSARAERPPVQADTAQAARNLALTASLRQRLKGAPALTEGERMVMAQGAGLQEAERTDGTAREEFNRKLMERRAAARKGD